MVLQNLAGAGDVCYSDAKHLGYLGHVFPQAVYCWGSVLIKETLATSGQSLWPRP